jgi:hypothetical protein
MLDQKDWSTIRSRAGSIHIVPNNDLIDHPRIWDCACRPEFESVSSGPNEFNWVFIHRALDRRID